MIYPPGGGGGGGGAAAGPAVTSSPNVVGGSKGVRRMRGGSKKVVQWRQQNVQQGIVIVDETQLSKLIKRESIEKFYDLDPAPFATGMFASVRRCRSRENGQLFAAKFCSRVRYGEDCSAEIHHELTLLSLCSPSPRIVRLHDVFETPSEVILVLEYAPGGDLQTIIDENMVPFESDVLKFVRQVVEGLAYIHERKIVHLDIKPQNLVMMGPFPDCDIKLCDFEISRVILEGAEVREILGTPDYVAPEIIHYEPITLGADMWSLGVTVYVLLTGFSPFGGETDQETFCNISRCELDFPAELFEDVSPEAQDFVARLLVRQPSARMTAKECLRHPWLAKKPRTPTSHLSSSMSSGINSRRSESPVLAAAAAAAAAAGGSGAAQKNLRKYLSKSREALFERVSGSNLRKTLSKSRERLCESHLSLVSKSRERLLMLEPSSRSIEKLYGLRSLSRSQDALSSKEIWAKNPALAAQHLLRCKSEATSLGREIECDDETTTPLPDDDLDKISNVETNTEILEDKTNPTNNLSNTNNTTVKLACKVPSQANPTPQSAVLVSKLCTPVITTPTTTEKENIINNRTTLNTTPHYKVDKNIRTENILSQKEISTPKSTRNKKDNIDKIDKLTKDGNNKENQGENEVENTVSLAQLGVNLEQTRPKLHDNMMNKNDDTGSDSSDKTIQAWPEKSSPTPTSEEDEPRYSVAQLVSAYNKNDQVAASSAITYDKTVPSKLKFVSSFPTGANALRLFIPDIVISDRNQKSSSPRLDMLTNPLSDIKECTVSSPETSLSPEPNVIEEHETIEETNNNNNNNTHCDNITECQYLKVPEHGKLEASVAFARSGSLSSEASGYDTLSGASSLVSLEESPPISLTTSSSQTMIKPEIKITRPRSSSLHADSIIKPPWGTVCTGSYSRAMERFHNKNNLIHQPHSERQRRKSTPTMKSSMK